MKKIILSALLIISIGTFTVDIPQVFANEYERGNENNKFNFYIPTGGYEANGEDTKPNGWSQEHPERSTSDYNNAWKLIFTESGEGYNTITRFWLENYNNKQHIAPCHDMYAGSGNTHYFRTHTTLSKTKKTALVAENNNPSTTGYTVSGYWDEETGVKAEDAI